MKKLEIIGLPLTESTDLVTTVTENLKTVTGDYEEKVTHKMESVLKRNVHFSVLLKISKILKGEHVKGPREVLAHHWGKFKYAPITLCDVERFFSAYKLILTDKRHQFKIDNIEKTIVAYCNYNK